MWVAVKLNDNKPKESKYIETNNLPEGFDEVWTESQFNTYLESVIISTNQTKESIHLEATKYNNLYYDNKGVMFLLNLKMDLTRNYPNDYTTILPYQMIEAVNRWINKLWAKAFEYDMIAANGGEVIIDYENEVGEPPCKFRDIIWVIDPTFQAIEPDRDVNTDINYYIDWQ